MSMVLDVVVRMVAIEMIDGSGRVSHQFFLIFLHVLYQFLVSRSGRRDKLCTDALVSIYI